MIGVAAAEVAPLWCGGGYGSGVLAVERGALGQALGRDVRRCNLAAAGAEPKLKKKKKKSELCGMNLHRPTPRLLVFPAR